MSDLPHKVPIPGPLAPLRSTVKQSVYRLLSGLRIAVCKKRGRSRGSEFPVTSDAGAYTALCPSDRGSGWSSCALILA
jgi:hypothetical protein